jgi:hypothetical protein
LACFAGDETQGVAHRDYSRGALIFGFHLFTTRNKRHRLCGNSGCIDHLSQSANREVLHKVRCVQQKSQDVSGSEILWKVRRGTRCARHVPRLTMNFRLDRFSPKRSFVFSNRHVRFAPKAVKYFWAVSGLLAMASVPTTRRAWAHGSKAAIVPFVFNPCDFPRTIVGKDNVN